MLTSNELVRYDKHIIMDEIGKKGQQLLKKAKVLIVGAGGLGSPILYYLTAVGIGNIGIVDSDRVELSNLQRQILHNENNLGEYKTVSAKDKLLMLNSNTNIEIYTERISKDNISSIIDNYDIVVDAVDNKQTRYIIHDECQRNDKIVVEGAVSKFEGFLYVVYPGLSVTYNQLFPNDEKMQSVGGNIGIVGAVAGIIGSLMALETIKIITGVGSKYINQILVFDGMKLEFRTINLSK